MFLAIMMQTVDSISDDLTTCTVSFEKYGNTEIVKVRHGLLV